MSFPLSSESSWGHWHAAPTPHGLDGTSDETSAFESVVAHATRLSGGLRHSKTPGNKLGIGAQLFPRKFGDVIRLRSPCDRPTSPSFDSLHRFTTNSRMPQTIH